MSTQALSADTATPAGEPVHQRPPFTLDAVGAAPEAIGVARQAALEVAPTAVGAHVGAVASDDLVVTHYFACFLEGYRGWQWAVSVARDPQAVDVTVCEVSLQPTAEAIVAPAWVPWSQRIAPGDMRPADQLPYRPDDPNLQLGFEPTPAEVQSELESVADQANPTSGASDADRLAIWELGLGRTRVLAPTGRAAAERRWLAGEGGPDAEQARLAQAHCETCGYLVPLPGRWRLQFGVCANEWSPADGRVVSLKHGCGAHSETDTPESAPSPVSAPVVDEMGADAVVISRRAATTTAPADTAVVDPEAEIASEAADTTVEGSPELEAGSSPTEFPTTRLQP